MAAQTMCPHCSKRYSVRDEQVGKRATCKGCGQAFTIEDFSGPARSPAGVAIFRPEPAAGAGKVATQATPFLEQIERHIERTIGPSPMVFHEIVSTDVHVDLHIVPAQPHVPVNDARPLGGDYVTVITSGMSSRPMKVSPAAKANGVSEYAELMLALPKDWPGLRSDGTFEQQEMRDEAKWWPFRWLKQMARLPHQYDTFFANGVTVPNGDPAKPFTPGSELCCWMVFKPLLNLPARQLSLGDSRRIDFFALFALTEREMQLKLDKGLDALLQALADGEVYTELLAPQRGSVV